MLEVNTHQSTGSKQALHALIFYASAAPDNQAWLKPSLDNSAIITMHNIENTQAGPVILEGKPVNQEGLETMFAQIYQYKRQTLQVFDPQLIALSQKTAVWWTPKQNKLMRFRTDEIGKRQAVLEQPPLLFVIHNGSWFVYALPKDERPTNNTKLLQSPYFNVWKNNQICVGSTRLPKTLDAFNPERWTNAFFQSAFTHTNNQNGVVKYKKQATASEELSSCDAFWIDMLDGHLKNFPMKVLKPTDLTLQSLLQKIDKGTF